MALWSHSLLLLYLTIRNDITKVPLYTTDGQGVAMINHTMADFTASQLAQEPRQAPLRAPPRAISWRGRCAPLWPSAAQRQGTRNCSP